jgi:pimeloyl-ACP methyl ester carboxylesterase
MAGFIREVCGGEAVHVLAESAGGGPACWLAIDHPELVASLLLAAPAALAERHAQPPGPPPSPERMSERLFGKQPGWTSPPDGGDFARRVRNAMANVGRVPSPSLREHLGEIACRTLILWGTADELIPPEQGQLYQKLIPGAFLMYVYGAAHALPVSACQQFVKLATEFIDRGDAFLVNMPQSF